MNLFHSLPLFLGQLDESSYQTQQVNPVVATIISLIYFGIIIVTIAGLWKTFTKAGQPGWGAIIPFYNAYLLLKIAGKPGWWLILMLIPFVNFVIAIILMIDVAKNFGKGGGFAVGLIFLPFVFFPILGFGSARYVGSTNGMLPGGASPYPTV